MKNFVMKILILMALGVVGSEVAQAQVWVNFPRRVIWGNGSQAQIAQSRWVGQGYQAWNYSTGGAPYGDVEARWFGSYVFVPGVGYMHNSMVRQGGSGFQYNRDGVSMSLPNVRPDGNVFMVQEGDRVYYSSSDPLRNAQAELYSARADAERAESDRYRARTHKKVVRWRDNQRRRNERAIGSERYQAADSIAWERVQAGRAGARVIEHYTDDGPTNRVPTTVLDTAEQRARRQLYSPIPDAQRAQRPASPAANRTTSSTPTAQSASPDGDTATAANPYPGMVRRQISRLADAVAVDDAVEAEASRQEIIRLGLAGYDYIASSPDQVDPQSWIGAVQTVLNQEGLAIHAGRSWFLDGVNGELAGRP